MKSIVSYLDSFSSLGRALRTSVRIAKETGNSAMMSLCRDWHRASICVIYMRTIEARGIVAIYSVFYLIVIILSSPPLFSLILIAFSNRRHRCQHTP